MSVRREGHTSTLLPNGKILIVGGGDFSTEDHVTHSSAEFYNSETGLFTLATDKMSEGRMLHTATLLPNGKLLIAGGNTYLVHSGYDTTISSTELYNPKTGLFTSVGNMEENRQEHTATLLPNGKVLIAGGWDGIKSYKSAELYNPEDGSITSAGNMNEKRFRHTATLLKDGKVLITGTADVNGIGTLAFGKSAELYDPKSNKFISVKSMSTIRANHSATLLPDGKVLIAGGYNGWTGQLRSAEVYDPKKKSFTLLAKKMVANRAKFRAILLSPDSSGDNSLKTKGLTSHSQVLFVGGGYGEQNSTSLMEVYDTGTGKFIPTKSLSTGRRQGNRIKIS